MSISRIYEITKRSLFTHQAAIDATANNIANVNTEGYSRRRIDLSRLSYGLIGVGSNSIERLHNQYIQTQILNENQTLGQNSMHEMILQQVEGIFDEPNDSGLANMLTKFWNSWTNLANDPESESARILVKDAGVMLANTFNRLDNNLKNLRDDVGVELQQKVTEVNSLISQIKEVNEKIAGNGSDDLLDYRDGLIEKLSEKMDIQISELDSGAVTITSGGRILLSENISNTLRIDRKQINGEVYSIDINMERGDKVLDISSGELGGLLEMYNGNIQEYRDKLDSLAINISEAVNEIHKSGYNLDGVTGVDFFKTSISGAGDFAVASEIVNNVNLIASTDAIDDTGNGSIAQLISDIQNSDIVNGSSIFDYYNSMITEIGSDVQEAQFLKSNQERVLTQLKNQKAAESGVSLDEEMAMLLQFEQAYQASARMVTVVDELMDTVLNML